MMAAREGSPHDGGGAMIIQGGADDRGRGHRVAPAKGSLDETEKSRDRDK